MERLLVGSQDTTQLRIIPVLEYSSKYAALVRPSRTAAEIRSVRAIQAGVLRFDEYEVVRGKVSKTTMIDA